MRARQRHEVLLRAQSPTSRPLTVTKPGSRISFKASPELANPISAFLAADENDHEIVGRLKNAIEGSVLGVVSEGLFHALGRFKRASDARAKGADAETIEGLLDEGADVPLISKDLDSAADALGSPTPTGETVKFEKTKNESGETIHVGELPDGSTVTLKSEGKDKWTVDGRRIPNVRTKGDAISQIVKDYEKRFDKTPVEPLAEFNPRELDRVTEEFERRLARQPIVEFDDGTIQQLGVDNSNPRKMSPSALVDEFMTEKSLNLSRMSPEPAALVRTLETMYERVTPKMASATVPNAELIRESVDNDLSNLLGGETPIGLAKMASRGQEDLALAHRLSVRKQSYRSALIHYADRVKRLVDEEATAKPERLAGIKKDKEVLFKYMMHVQRVVTGLKAQSGRDLQAWRIEYDEKLSEAIRLSGGDPATVMDMVRHSRKSTLLDMSLEWFQASILSGGKTLAINPLAGAMQVVTKFTERLMGAAITRDLPGMKATLQDLSSLLDMTRSAFKPAFESLKDGKPRLGASKTSDLHAPAITVENLNYVTGNRFFQPDSGWGVIAKNVFDHGVRYPFKVLGATDEFIKRTAVNAHAKSMFTREFMEQGFDVKQAAELAGRKVEDVTYRNQLVSEQVLIQKHMDQLRESPAAEFMTAEAMKEAAVESARKEWDSQDGVLLRAVAGDSMRAADEAALTTPLDSGGRRLERFGASLLKFERDNPALKFIIPFIRTPTNIILQAQDRTLDPMVGIIKWMGSRTLGQSDSPRGALAAELRGGPSESGATFAQTNKIKNRFLREMLGDIDLHGLDPNGREAATIRAQRKQEAWGRVATGAGLFSTVMMFAADGRITGRGPKDAKQRQILEGTGWQPYSIKFGDSYIEYARFDPIATIVGTIADFFTIGRYTDAEDERTISDMSMAAVTAIAHNTTNKTYLAGFKNFIAAMDDPENVMPRYLGNMAASFVPNGPSQVGHFVAGDEPVQREVREWTDAIWRKIPYYGESVDPVRNFLGEPVHKTKALGEDSIGSVMGLFMPVAHSEVSDDLIAKELADLQHSFSSPSRKAGGIDLTTFRSDSGQSAYDRLLQLRSEVKVGGKNIRAALKKLIRSREYKQMDPQSTLEFKSPRVAALNRVVQQFHRAAVKKMRREFPEVAAEQQRVLREKRDARFSTLQSLR